jgi:uncharacterized 2Fe-2S/4Fe-4S cluster protein (DUF4445 family)
VDGAIVSARLNNSHLEFVTIADEAPVGLTGSGLLSLVHTLRKAGVIEPSGRIAPNPPILANQIVHDQNTGRRILLTEDGRLGLSQWDIRELQKAKGAIRAAMDTLMAHLDLKTQDLKRIILTGSFGGQIDIASAIDLGMIPPVTLDKVETIANGAGFGAAMFLSEAGFELGERIAREAQQVDLDKDAGFSMRYVEAMTLTPNQSELNVIKTRHGSTGLE